MANDFSGDSNCKALWKFENGALTTDSKGSNTLTDGYHAPVADTVNYKEGSASVDMEADLGDGYYISDASLDAGFPMKNGDANKKVSVCFWIKFESFSDYGDRYIYSKGIIGTYSFALVAHAANGYPVTVCNLQLWIGYNSGDSQEVISYGTTWSTGVWYHVGVTFDDSDKSYRIRIWDDNASAILGTELTGTATNNINIEDGILTIGSHNNALYFMDGLIDEMVVFDDILTADEIDQIRGGTYGGSPPVAAQYMTASKYW